MPKDVTRTITVCCTDIGAALKISFDAEEITSEIMRSLDKCFEKKGVAAQWNGEATNPDLLIRVVSIDQGNQFLRYLLPFIAPAVLEVEGQLAVPGSGPQQLHYVQKAQMGLFGGSARGMLKVCAQRVSDKITRDVLRSLK